MHEVHSAAPRIPSVEYPGLHREHAADPSFSEILPAAQRLHKVAFPEEKEPAEQDIVLKDKTPIRSKYYTVPSALKAKAGKEVQRLMDLRIIEPSSSPFHSPSFCTIKKDGP